jgi:PKD repeat protein
MKQFNFNITTMNQSSGIQVIILLVSGIICFNSCTKNLPIVTTTVASDITQTSATSGGNLTNNGGAEVTAHGVCWSTTENPPTISSSKTSDGTGNGAFISNITGLLANTKYYLCAYATNSEGTGYGLVVNFTTNGNPPVAGFSASPTTITTGQSLQFTDQSTNTPTSWSWNFGDGGTST